MAAIQDFIDYIHNILGAPAALTPKEPSMKRIAIGILAVALAVLPLLAYSDSRVPQNSDIAQLRSDASVGNHEAQYKLGLDYEKGRG